MRLLKGLMACLAALFVLGYVNSCESIESEQSQAPIKQEESRAA